MKKRFVQMNYIVDMEFETTLHNAMYLCFLIFA